MEEKREVLGRKNQLEGKRGDGSSCSSQAGKKKTGKNIDPAAAIKRWGRVLER